MLLPSRDLSASAARAKSSVAVSRTATLLPPRTIVEQQGNAVLGQMSVCMYPLQSCVVIPVVAAGVVVYCEASLTSFTFPCRLYHRLLRWLCTTVAFAGSILAGSCLPTYISLPYVTWTLFVVVIFGFSTSGSLSKWWARTMAQ